MQSEGDGKRSEQHGAPHQSRPNVSARASTRLRSQNPQLESDSLATTPQGAQDGYFPSSGEASTSATPAVGSVPGSVSAQNGRKARAEPNDQAAQHRDLASEGGFQSLRESLSAHSHHSQRRSTNAEEGIALPDNVKDFGKRSGAPTPPRLQTDSAALPGPGERPELPNVASDTAAGQQPLKKGNSTFDPPVRRGPSLLSRPGMRSTGDGAPQSGQNASTMSATRVSRMPRVSEVANPRLASSSRTRPAPPFSLAGAQQASTSTDASVSARSRPSRTGPLPGVAVPRPRPRDAPSWAGKARKKPLYSLGKPLPTHEEVQAQKEWEEQMKRIKEKYPDAEPPAPPPLPSQQETSGTYAAAAGGMQIDREQLQDVIRTVIAEFKNYENGIFDAGSVRTTSVDQVPARRRSFYDPASRPQSRRNLVKGENEDGGSELAELDSVVIEDDDDEPLPESRTPFQARPPRIPSKTSRYKRPSRASRASDAVEGRKSHSAAQPAFADQGRKEQQEKEYVVREKEQEADDDKADKPQPAMPSQPKKRTSRDSESTMTEGQASHKGDSIDGSPRMRRPSQASRILSRDHEEEGNWSEDEDDPHQLPADAILENRSVKEEQEADEFPNPLAKLRSAMREPAAEFLGAMALSIIGIGASTQNGLLANPAISLNGQGSLSAAVNISQPFAWGIGVAISVYIAGGVSGGHISPVISIVLAVFRGFPWAKVPEYIAAQLLGFIAGSGVTYGLYRHAISIVEGNGGMRTLGDDGTASYLATYPVAYLSNANAFFNEFVAVAVLVILVLAIGDATNVPPPAGLNPLILMFTVIAIGLALGNQTGYALNPARDLGPRLVSWMAGYGLDVWNNRNQYWLWCVWLGDISGGLFGAALYDILIFEGEESPMNWRWHWRNLHPNVMKARYARWRKKIRVRNETRKESWLQRHHARKEKKTAQNSQKKEEV